MPLGSSRGEGCAGRRRLLSRGARSGVIVPRGEGGREECAGVRAAALVRIWTSRRRWASSRRPEAGGCGAASGGRRSVVIGSGCGAAARGARFVLGWSRTSSSWLLSWLGWCTYAARRCCVAAAGARARSMTCSGSIRPSRLRCSGSSRRAAGPVAMVFVTRGRGAVALEGADRIAVGRAVEGHGAGTLDLRGDWNGWTGGSG